jgi:hypothetical protein
MTTPTQAQREAAKQLVAQLDQLLMQNRYNEAEFIVACALTATAQVGERKSPDIHGTPSEIWDTAYHAGFHAGQTSIEKATIERCAQVAETYDMDGDLKDGLPKGWEGCRRMIAAAIRKLKDGA